MILRGQRYFECVWGGEGCEIGIAHWYLPQNADDVIYGRKLIGSCSQCDSMFRLNCRQPLREIDAIEAEALAAIMMVQLS
jgi:hypothetical protein